MNKMTSNVQPSKSNSAITLIALIITIIVLLILAGVTLHMVMGERGIIKKAETASEETNKEDATEKLSLKITNVQMNTYVTKRRMPTLQELANELDNDNEIEYVKKKKVEVGSLADVNIGDATSILTKLKDYKYEFEINNKFQLASIDGEKISDSNYSSQVINNIEISAGEINGEDAEINININFKNGYSESDIVAYFIVANNEVKAMNTVKPTQINNLSVATKYNVYVMTVDKYAGVTKSKPIEIETKDMVSTVLEYPIITSSGIKNIINTYKDGKKEYVLKKDIECTTDDAVGKNAYDGDLNTDAEILEKVDKGWINVDSSAIGKKIKIEGARNCCVVQNGPSGSSLASTGNNAKPGATLEFQIPEGTTKLYFTTYARRLGNLYVSEIIVQQ